MPIEPVIGTELSYYLLAYDKDGTERREGNDEFLSERLEKDLSSGAVTDVFMFSHGWKGASSSRKSRPSSPLAKASTCC